MSDGPLQYDAALSTPAHATAVVFSATSSELAIGSDDGSVRVYASPYQKVQKAIRSLGDSVSGLMFSGEGLGNLWIATGRKLLRFNLAAEKMILVADDALSSHTFSEDEDDALNDIALNAGQTHIAITSDSGEISVLEIASGETKKMRTKHTSIAWKAVFVPTRTNELVSGGYDCTLLHCDYKLGNSLSSFEVAATPEFAPGISTLPPFITAVAMSSTGAIAAGTADGRIWVGGGGLKSSKPADKNNKARKWHGLDKSEGSFTKSAEVMISDLVFLDTRRVLSCTVSGKLTLYTLVPAAAIEPGLKPGQVGAKRQVLQQKWAGMCASMQKVDKMALECSPDGRARVVAICGLGKDGKGRVELWKVT